MMGMEEAGPLMGPPTVPAVPPPPQDYAIPPLAPQPRLVPQPQAPADAYSPAKNNRPRLLGQLER
jgi:hypothetical protein